MASSDHRIDITVCTFIRFLWKTIYSVKEITLLLRAYIFHYVHSEQQEFYIWLRDEKQIEPETQPPFEITKLWEDFAEDFNTATLPNEKYYNLEGWEAKQARKRKKASAAEATSQPKEFSIADDERAMQARGAKVSHTLSLCAASWVLVLDYKHA